ncbi:hypothetical protein [Acuticoccus mangrovi]|uniref:Uncharacterized protein n=1 Tax=Acuticoccus mangrovi TaxID=2796142 RepID=A0A934MGS8_9HYPH|nr:hypothetical protein [Acuticoccus mangrovi]MBJ3776230.1 hypothetical protein [Acuticoccus mangrovi]
MTEATDCEDELKQLKTRVGRLWRQLELERKKNFALTEALIRHLDIGVCPANSPYASLAPIERDAGDDEYPIIAFGGMATALSMPFAEFKRFLSSGNQTSYFVKDLHQAWYQFGLLGLTEGVTDTAEYLRAMLPPTVREVSCVGTSAGGFGAILMGVLMGAARVVAFGPQTALTPAVVRAFRSQDTRAEDIRQHGTHLDLVPVLQRNTTTEIVVHVSNDHMRDRVAADRIEGLPGVSVHRYEVSNHRIAAWLKEHGRLGEALAPVLRSEHGASTAAARAVVS